MDYDQSVTIDLGDGKTLECVVLTIFEAGKEGREYIAVMPEDDEDMTDVYLYRYKEVDGEPQLENIESDEEYEIVAEEFDEILDEQEYNEMINRDLDNDDDEE